jgi:hypothetical protein
MKNTILLSFILLAMTGFAQKNAVKLGLASVKLGDFNVNYERALTEKSSLNFNIGYWNIGSSSIDILKNFESNDPDAIKLQKFNGKLHSSLEYRMYVNQKGSMKGLYMAPYIRYWGQEANMSDVIYINEYQDNYDFSIDAKINSLGAGLQIGYQWIIRDQITIDWYFIGIGVEHMTLNGEFRTDQEEPYNYETQEDENFNYSLISGSVKNTFSDVDFVAKRVKTEAKDDHLLVKIPLWLPGIRSGFTIGFAF